jgi:hypothetical protein
VSCPFSIHILPEWTVAEAHVDSHELDCACEKPLKVEIASR